MNYFYQKPETMTLEQIKENLIWLDWLEKTGANNLLSLMSKINDSSFAETIESRRNYLEVFIRQCSNCGELVLKKDGSGDESVGLRWECFECQNTTHEDYPVDPQSGDY
jgi:hypothetical protein